MEMAAEVKRLKEENDRLRRLYEREREIADRLKEENNQLQHWQITGANAINEKEMYRHKLQDSLNTLQQIADFPVVNPSGLTKTIKKFAKEAIDRLQGQEGIQG